MTVKEGFILRTVKILVLKIASKWENRTIEVNLVKSTTYETKIEF